MKLSARLVPLAAAIMLQSACTTTTMVRSQPLAVPSGLTKAQVSDSVKKALAGRGWVLTGSTADSYMAKLTGNGWEATVRTVYDTHEVRLEYAGSRGLNHSQKNGTETINRHWNSWMSYLTQDIRANMAAQAYGR